jgi:phosphatidylglycerol---prolipoprotein diacylglyceryl transferase
MDYLAAATPIGLSLGRIANFVNGELYGRVTDAPWGMIFPDAGGLPRHPSQLYESATEGLLLFLLLYLAIRYTRIMQYRGAVGGLFLAGYAMARFSMEFFRMPDPQLGFLFGQWLTMGQLLCVPMFAAGTWIAMRAKRHTAS